MEFGEFKCAVCPIKIEWISVDKRLPREKDGVVIICTEDGKVMTGKHNEIEHTWLKGVWDGSKSGKVIAWMPLPKPYKGEGEAE